MLNKVIELLFINFITFYYLFGESNACLRCFIDNDNATTPELIERYGYALETHEMVTEDGYILALYRIPHGKTYRNLSMTRPVLIQHGVLCSSTYFVQIGPNKSLAFLLADAGYDVWMINSRGNTFSRRHQYLDPDVDPQFWNFSIEALATVDLANTIDYVLNYTNREKLSLIGHSQGCTLFYILTTMLPEYNNKINAHISLGPAVFLKHMKADTYRAYAKLTNMAEYILSKSGIEEVFPHRQYSKFVFKLLFRGFGKPTGTSRKVFTHYSYLIRTGEFVRYDYGSTAKNLEVYGTKTAPAYNLTKITTDVWIFHVINDWVATRKDIKTLLKKLKNNKYTIGIEDPNFTHMDFIYGEDIVDLVYNKIIKILNTYRL